MYDRLKAMGLDGTVPTNHFNVRRCLSGLGIIQGEDSEPVHCLYGRGRADEGLGIIEARRFRATVDDAILAMSYASTAHADQCRALLNVVGSSVGSRVNRNDVRAARGLAVRLPFGPSGGLDTLPEDEREVPAAWLNMISRLSKAGAEPITVVDGIRSQYLAAWLFDRPVYLHHDEGRKAVYCAMHRRLVAAVGGIPSDDPLIDTLPMPGAVDFRIHGPGITSCVGVDYFSLSESLGFLPPRYGTSIEDFAAVIDQIEATPLVDVVNGGRK